MAASATPGRTRETARRDRRGADDGGGPSVLAAPAAAPTSRCPAAAGAASTDGPPPSSAPRRSRRAVSRVRPGVADAAIEAEGLLHHHRRQLAGARAVDMPVPERVPDLVVDDVLPVPGQVVVVVVGAVDPPVEGDHRLVTTAARQRAPRDQWPAQPF